MPRPSLIPLLLSCLMGPVLPAAQDGPLAPFLGKADITIQRVFEGERFPNIVVTPSGTVLTSWGSEQIRVRRSEDGGATWGTEILVAPHGIQGGGTTVDETTGDILIFTEATHPPAPITVYRSTDDGRTWKIQPTEFSPDSQGNLPAMHMNEHGITLQRGPHAGRLLRASRYYGLGNRPESVWHTHYTNAIYSDDGGKSWHTSAPFPENGTGEATVAELSDGRIYYNSRVHWQERPNNTRRREAWSHDGGETWTDFRIIDVLPDGQQHRSYGCMGGLVRLPVAGHDILIFSNLDTPEATRERATVWASFDGGQTWPVKRLVFDGPSAYSSLNAGRHGTASAGWIYLNFESEGGAKVARFNLSWLLAGESTGDGEIPRYVLVAGEVSGDEFRARHGLQSMSDRRDFSPEEAEKLYVDWREYRLSHSLQGSTLETIRALLDLSLDIADICLTAKAARNSREIKDYTGKRYRKSDPSPEARAYDDYLMEVEHQFRIGETIMHQIVVDMDSAFGRSYTIENADDERKFLAVLHERISDYDYCVSVISFVKKIK